MNEQALVYTERLFYEDFESGQLRPAYWTKGGTYQMVRPPYAYAGNYSLKLTKDAWAELAFDPKGGSFSHLNFVIRTFNLVSPDEAVVEWLPPCTSQWVPLVRGLFTGWQGKSPQLGHYCLGVGRVRFRLAATVATGREVRIDNIDIFGFPNSCGNGVLDPGEADVDCGASCNPCANGRSCQADSECLSGTCAAGVCAVGSCSDGRMNPNEQGIDCGAIGCQACECQTDADCGFNAACTNGACGCRHGYGGPEASCQPRLTLGGAHGCVWKDDSFTCWGDNQYGQLGRPQSVTGSAVRPSQAQSVSVAPRKIRSLVARYFTTYAVLDDGSVRTWGEGTVPAFGPGERVRYIVSNGYGTGSRNACAVLETGTLRCWGDDVVGETGHCKKLPANDPSMPLVDLQFSFADAPVSDVALGAGHACARLDDGKTYCWGNGANIGLSMSTAHHYAPAPIKLPDGRTALQLAGESGKCVLLDDGTVTCWGVHSLGTLAGGTRVNFGGRRIRTLSSQGKCGITESNELYCWGRIAGEARCGSSQVCSSPVSYGPNVVSAAADNYNYGMNDAHCLLATDGTIKCWGYNRSGLVGESIGATVTAPTPIAVRLPSP